MRDIDYSKVPVDYMTGAVQRYIENGINPGDFLIGIITNNLRKVLHHADAQNEKHIKEWVRFFMWEAPATCWGSEKVMMDWIDSKRPNLENRFTGKKTKSIK